MDTNKKDIGTLVKNRLDGFKSSPDEFVWSNIETQLKKKKKKRLFILWLSGLGLSVLLFLMLTYGSLHNTTSIDREHADEVISETNTTNVSNTKERSSETQLLYSDDTQEASHTISKEYHHKSSKDKLTKSPYKAPKQKNNTNKSFNYKEHNPIHKNSIQSLTKKKEAITSANQYTAKNTPKALTLIDSISKIEQNPVKVLNKSIMRTSKEKVVDSLTSSNRSRWSVTPHALITYYGTLSAKSNDNFSINYGLLLSYRATELTHIRTGVRKLNLNQTIDNSQINVEYLEFPLEIKYAPLNKKLNPYLTGGIHYFLPLRSKLGNQTNLDFNNTFSLNFGLGIEYELIKDFRFNIEPSFNYQIKPFSQNNDINPFIFSLHAGIEYRF